MPCRGVKGQTHLHLLMKMSYLFKVHWNKDSGSFLPCKPEMQQSLHVFPGESSHSLVLLFSFRSLSQARHPAELLNHGRTDGTFPYIYPFHISLLSIFSL